MQGKHRYMQTIQIANLEHLFQLGQITLLKAFMMPRDFRNSKRTPRHPNPITLEPHTNPEIPPELPTKPVSQSPSLTATTKDRPILLPLIAMALMRFSLRGTSASKAITTADTAPPPAMARPIITP